MFGFLFWLVKEQLTLEALASNLRLSFLALINPVSAIENAGPELFGALTILLGFIGFITWPVFITTLAKKYGR